jgi:hybrid cluster-associated redox disulfide protein
VTGKISKRMTLGELIEKHPKAAMKMAEGGMHCIGCGMAAMETIEEGCRAHGMSDADIDKLIDEMEKAETGNK